jgi:hypothetical protein
MILLRAEIYKYSDLDPRAAIDCCQVYTVTGDN